VERGIAKRKNKEEGGGGAGKGGGEEGGLAENRKGYGGKKMGDQEKKLGQGWKLGGTGDGSQRRDGTREGEEGIFGGGWKRTRPGGFSEKGCCGSDLVERKNLTPQISSRLQKEKGWDGS